MVFDYSVYYKNNFILPLVISLITVFFVIASVRTITVSIKREDSLKAKGLFVHSIFLLAMILLLVVHLIPLLRGGIFLFSEKEADKIVISGIIEKIEEINYCSGVHYNTDEKKRSGEALIINGNKYYIVTHGQFNVGDRVLMEVLPQSKFVLKINKNSR